MSTAVNGLAKRDERKDDIRRTLKILLGVIALLVTVSVVTILVKH